MFTLFGLIIINFIKQSKINVLNYHCYVNNINTKLLVF